MSQTKASLKNQVSPKVVAVTFGILVLLFLGGFYILAWTEPGQAPPGGNVPAPVNVGAQAQSKTGDLSIGTGLKYWLTKLGDSFALKNNANQIKFVLGQDGKVGIGTTSPAELLDVAGNAKVNQNLQVVGQTNTTDKTGLGRYANWRTDQTSDPADAPEGTVYYNTNSDVFRCKLGNVWANCSPQFLAQPDGPWVKIINPDTNNPNDPTLRFTVTKVCGYSGSLGGSGCTLVGTRSPWKERIMPAPIKAIRISNGTGSIRGNSDHVCRWEMESISGGGAAAVNIESKFTGISTHSNVSVPAVLLNGNTPTGNNIYDFSSASNNSFRSPARGVSANFNFGNSDFDLTLLASGQHNSSTEGANAGKYWSKLAGLTMIPGGERVRFQGALHLDYNAGRLGAASFLACRCTLRTLWKVRFPLMSMLCFEPFLSH